MANENTETQMHQHSSTPQEGDRRWAQKLAEERERRDIERFETLKQQQELMMRGVSSVGVDVKDTKEKVDAIFETVCTPEPTSAVGKAVHMADQAIKRVLPYLTVASALAALGYGGYRGGKAVVNRFRKKEDATIKPVGEPVAAPKR